MTTEEKLKDLIAKYSWDTQRCADKIISSGILNSQPPNLDLINQITQLTKERDELKKKNRDGQFTLDKTVENWLIVQQQLQDVTKERDELRTEFKEVRDSNLKTFDSLNEQLQAVTKERDELRIEIEDITNQLMSEEQKCHKLNAELQAAKDRIKELKGGG